MGIVVYPLFWYTAYYGIFLIQGHAGFIPSTVLLWSLGGQWLEPFEASKSVEEGGSEERFRVDRLLCLGFTVGFGV